MRRGLPAFTLVGLPDTAVREARERVRAALLNSGLEFPLQRLTANLAPARLRKAGPSFDLALAVALLVASGQVPSDWFASCAVCGELSLSGALRRVHGAVAVAAGARRAGYERLIVPAENADEAALVDGIEVFGVPSLGRLVDLVRDRWRPEPPRPTRDVQRRRVLRPRPRGRARSARREAGTRDRGRGRAQPSDGRSAGRGKDDARAAASRHPAAADASRRRVEITRIHSVAGLSGRSACHRAAVPRASSHDLGGRADRRRIDAAPGRDHARPPRRAVPRRAPRVLATGARGPAAAARGGTRRDHARSAVDRVSRRGDARRRLQRLPVRAAAR